MKIHGMTVHAVYLENCIYNQQMLIVFIYFFVFFVYHTGRFYWNSLLMRHHVVTMISMKALVDIFIFKGKSYETNVKNNRISDVYCTKFDCL